MEKGYAQFKKNRARVQIPKTWQKLKNKMVAIVNFGNTKNVPCAVFGNGTLEITNITGTGILDGVEIPTKSIVIKTIPKGSEVGHYADSNSFEPQMVMSFLNEDAFCVLKDVIERIYEEYQSEKLKIK